VLERGAFVAPRTTQFQPMLEDREHTSDNGSPPPLSLIEPLLDADAVATLLAVKPSWVYEAVRSKRIPYLRIGRHIRFQRSDIEAWVAERRHQ
jgi:excisionase family DNA binding protein